MQNPPDEPLSSELAGARGEEIDPWSEFLSESSDDLSPSPQASQAFAAEEAVSGTVSARDEAPYPRDDRRDAAYAGLPAVRDNPTSANVPGLAPARRLDVEPLQPPVAIARQPAQVPAATGVIAVADVLARQTPVHWSEAVAVVQELCAILQGEEDAAVPPASDVLLTSAGTVTVRRLTKGRFQASDLARMLHDLLSASSPPLPLRLFVTSSVASERYRDVALYADALSLYAAPLAERADLIRALYLRSIDPPAVTRIDLRMASGPDGPRRVRVRAVLLGMAAVLLLMLGVGAAYWLGQASARSGLTAMAPAGDATAPAAEPRDVERAELVGLSGDFWRPGTITGALPPPRRRTEEATTFVPEPAALPPAMLPSAPRVIPLAAPPEVATTEVGEANRRQVAERLPPPPPAARAVAAPDPTIYSSEHPEVEPPVLLSPLAPPPADPGSRANNTIVFIINELGAVEHVSFLYRTERLIDATFLSAAKSVKFRPAMRNGRPVKYQLHIDWSSPAASRLAPRPSS